MSLFPPFAENIDFEPVDAGRAPLPQIYRPRRFRQFSRLLSTVIFFFDLRAADAGGRRHFPRRFITAR